MNVIKLRCVTLMEWGERMKQTINLVHIITMEISNENVQFSNVTKIQEQEMFNLSRHSSRKKICIHVLLPQMIQPAKYIA